MPSPVDALSDRLRAALAAGPPLRLAVLFGSQATGRTREWSDVDVGILPVDPDLPLHDELLLASALSAAVAAEVDVVRLDADAPQLGAEVARHGLCLFEAAPGVFAAYRAEAMSRWIDFEETIAPHRAVSPQARRGGLVTNVALVARKLAVLEEHLRRLRERRPAEVTAFASDPLLQDAIAMSVLVMVQEALDIALHIATDEGWELASTTREAFAVLERHGVIAAPLAESLGGAAQLRNRIAHGYASLDAGRLWAELPAGIASFGAFAAAVSAFVQRAP